MFKLLLYFFGMIFVVQYIKTNIMYFPVTFKKFGDDYFAVKVENSIESENIEDVYDWIDEQDTVLDFESFKNCMEDGKLPDIYHVFYEDCVGYVLLTKKDYGNTNINEFDDEECLRTMFDDDFVNRLMEFGEFYDDSECDCDEIDDGGVFYELKKVMLKK